MLYKNPFFFQNLIMKRIYLINNYSFFFKNLLNLTKYCLLTQKKNSKENKILSFSLCKQQ